MLEAATFPKSREAGVPPSTEPTGGADGGAPAAEREIEALAGAVEEVVVGKRMTASPGAIDSRGAALPTGTANAAVGGPVAAADASACVCVYELDRE